MPPQAVRNKIRDGSLMKRGLIEEQGKGGSEACCCLIQWDAPGAWRLAHFNCTPLSFIKGSMQRYSFNESESKAGYSVSFSHTHWRIMWLCWLGPHVLAHTQTHTATNTHDYWHLEENREQIHEERKNKGWKITRSAIYHLLHSMFLGI